MAKRPRNEAHDDLGRPAKNPRSRVHPLILVLDLDHTLLHSCKCSLSPEETKLINQLHKLHSYDEEDDLIPWAPESMLTKLRPSVHQFLKQAKALGFQICIYTMGTPQYANFASDILDPDGTYFGNRIFSREDCTRPGWKGLDVVVNHENERYVIIIDDTEVVWEHHKANLIHIEPYIYFDTSPDFRVRSLSECKVYDENDYALVSVLGVLARARCSFLQDPDKQCRDVRLVLGEMKKQVLKGCNIMFHKFSQSNEDGTKSTWMMAREMGANCCSIEFGAVATVTHVISRKINSKASNWAKRNQKFLVSPLWVESAYYSWRRQEEMKFALF